MSFADVRQSLVRDFVTCVETQQVPPLAGYFSEHVKSGCEVSLDDYRLVALIPSGLRYLVTSSNCVTDCMFELQSKYAQFVPDDWGGHMEKGRRDVGVVGFNILEGIVLDIQELNPTGAHLDWAQPKLNALQWERLLIHAVVDFGRSCGAKQIWLQPAHGCPVEPDVAADPVRLATARDELKQRYDDHATAAGFAYDPSVDRFVLNLDG